MRVALLREGRDTTWFAVSHAEGKPPITVRIGKDGVFCCLTCLKTDCAHCVAAERFYHEHHPTDG